MKTEKTFYEKLIINTYKTIRFVGVSLFTIEFNDLLNMLFKTDKFDYGDGCGTMVFIIVAIVCIYLRYMTDEIEQRYGN